MERLDIGKERYALDDNTLNELENYLNSYEYDGMYANSVPAIKLGNNTPTL